MHFRSGRNYVGTFYQPGLVLTDLDTLASLPESELRGGMAEVVKYAFLVGGSLWESVCGYASGHGGVTQDMVLACARVKVKIVAGDEREESGERALLNLGHTVGPRSRLPAPFVSIRTARRSVWACAPRSGSRPSSPVWRRPMPTAARSSFQPWGCRSGWQTRRPRR